mmetsp:Transcript_14594/g.21516  ORF Transcript_14594/g.21516 Transcript_14594/m.21516 type:complete len:126 (+) Transcript_14594:451-828(+)
MSYHLGVAKCLLDHGILKTGEEQIVTGVSGGALVAASLVYGIEPIDSMEEVLKVASSARKNALNIYKPGYSVLDIVELHIKEQFLKKFLSNEEQMQAKYTQDQQTASYRIDGSPLHTSCHSAYPR